MRQKHLLRFLAFFAIFVGVTGGGVVWAQVNVEGQGKPVEIISPKNGVSVKPGDIIHVAVRVRGDMPAGNLEVSGFSGSKTFEGPGLHEFEDKIPSGQEYGAAIIFAMFLPDSLASMTGEMNGTSIVEVTGGGRLIGIEVEPKFIALEGSYSPGDNTSEVRLDVKGLFSDQSTADITHFTGTTYKVEDEKIASLVFDKQPSLAPIYVRGLKAGGTTIVVQNGSIVVKVPVTVRSSNRLPVALIRERDSKGSYAELPTVTIGTPVTLDGSRSSDPNGDTLHFLWLLTRQPAGSQAAIDKQDQVIASLVPDKPGSYEVELRVGDRTGQDLTGKEYFRGYAPPPDNRQVFAADEGVFTAIQAVSLAKSTVQASEARIPADGTTTGQIVVVLVNDAGQPVVNQEVILRRSKINEVLWNNGYSSKLLKTNGEGRVTFDISSQLARGPTRFHVLVGGFKGLELKESVVVDFYEKK